MSINMLETTINIDIKLLNKLNSTCDKFNVSRSYIISLLIKKIASKTNKKSFKMFKKVEYQARKDKNCWKILHVYFSENTYERCLDLRKFCKISVSRFISEGIIKYLKEIENILKEKNISSFEDNYLVNYLFVYNEYEKITNLNIYWDIPPEKILEKSCVPMQ